MQRAIAFLKGIILLATACLCLVFAYALLFSPVFPQGERHEFYRGTSSDEIVLARSPYEKIFLTGIKGESARYAGDKTRSLIERYGAEILFVEEAAGVVNYYCYSPALEGGVQLNGKKINLHVACNGAETAAGTPLIFGGF